MSTETSQRLRNQHRKNTNQDLLLGVLGDANGYVPDPDYPGNVLVRELTPNGLSQARTAKPPNSGYLTMEPGTYIELEYDKRGNLHVAGPDTYTGLAMGVNPLTPILQALSQWVAQSSFATLAVLPTSPPSLAVSIAAWNVVNDGQWTPFVGITTDDLTLPSADEQYYAVLFVRDDFSTVDVQYSTAIPIADYPNTAVAIQECLDLETASYPTATSVWALLLTSQQDTFTLNDIQNDGVDLRQSINVNASASTANMFQQDIINRSLIIETDYQGNYSGGITIVAGGSLAVNGRLYVGA